MATALASALQAGGYPVEAVYSRSGASAQRLASQLDGGAIAVCPEPQSVADLCDLVFITTPDDVISDTAATIRWNERHQVAHCSGALSIEVLEPVRRAGGKVGGFHPMRSFALPEADSLRGVTFALEGDGPLLETLKEMAASLGGDWVVVPSQDKTLYHISAVLASNYLVTLLKAATELWKGLDVPEPQARKALLSLMSGTLDSVESLGTSGSLTGPIARGDYDTIRRHLDRLETTSPTLRSAYRSLGLLTIPIAAEKGTLEGDTAARLRDLLTDGINAQETERQLAR